MAKWSAESHLLDLDQKVPCFVVSLHPWKVTIHQLVRLLAFRVEPWGWKFTHKNKTETCRKEMGTYTPSMI